jgi:hypothetical protein
LNTILNVPKHKIIATSHRLNEVANDVKESNQELVGLWGEKFKSLDEEVSLLKSKLEGMLLARNARDNDSKQKQVLN